MNIYTTQQRLALATGRRVSTICARLRNLPFDRYRDPSSDHVVNRYALPRVLPTIKASERPALSAIFGTAIHEGGHHVEDHDPEGAEEALRAWMTHREQSRLTAAQARFVGGMAHSLASSEIFKQEAHLRATLVFVPEVLRFALLGDDRALPCWDSWAVPHALANATRTPHNMEPEYV